MIARVRASLTTALVLLGAGSTSAAAQQRACSAADSARVGWAPPPGVDDETWRATLLAHRLVTPGTELVRIPYDSLPSDGFDVVSQLNRELDRVVRARTGDGPARIVVLQRIEPDSTMSRLLLALPSGMVGIEESIAETTRRLRFSPPFRDGCPLAVWYPIIVETLPTRTISAAPAPFGGRAQSSEWVNLVTITRLRDEFAARPDEANLQGPHSRGWANVGWREVLPEPFRSRTFVGESYVLLDVDSAGHAAGCRPLRTGAHPELDAFACTLLMRPGYFSATFVPQRESLAGQWVMGLRWESLTAAAYRERPRDEGTYELARPPSPRPPNQ